METVEPIDYGFYLSFSRQTNSRSENPTFGYTQNVVCHFMKIFSNYILLFIVPLSTITTSFSQIHDTSRSQSDFIIPEKRYLSTNDFAGIFTNSEVLTLDSIVIAYEKSTTIEIVIVTFDSTWITKDNFDKFVLKIHNSWGVGKVGSNNGIVIGICTGLRRIRISNGYGIENKISDEETKKIMDHFIIPEFRKANFFEGIRKGLLALISRLQ